ncbi:hypothetical protein D7S89_17030 [Trinickia fusca]|uniref:DUF1877 family protein n=2 Tax=Trinickia fusca TaxID=2419777 RepID=A0A494XCU9_9BURK|nr:hypothetical protein D7S89_17030 [Trinickia fusca]
MGEIGVGAGKSAECDLEDSVNLLGNELELQPYPLGKLFIGELHAELNEFDDPNVSFLGCQLAKDIATALNTVEENFFDSIATHHPPNPYTWLLRDLRRFFDEVALRSNAVVCLWEP